MQRYGNRDKKQVDHHFRPFGRDIAQRLRARAAELESRAHAKGDRDYRADWHRGRADAQDKPLQDVAADCGKSTMVLACSCTVHPVEARCGRYKFCDTCLTKRRQETHARISRSMQKALADNAGAQVYLCTITTWHSGNIAADLKFLKSAVPEFIEASRAFGALSPYVYVFELTNGDDGLGHVHAHVAMLAHFLDYHGSADQWRLISARHGRPGTDERRLQVPNYRRDPKASAAWRDCSQVSSYLASHSLPSYLSKTEEVDGLTDELLGQWIGATWSKRLLITSWHFWVDEFAKACKCCGNPFQVAAFTSSRAALQRLLDSALATGLALKVVLPHHVESS